VPKCRTKIAPEKFFRGAEGCKDDGVKNGAKEAPKQKGRPLLVIPILQRTISYKSRMVRARGTPFIPGARQRKRPDFGEKRADARHHRKTRSSR
jgi:hypothetical protein